MNGIIGLSIVGGGIVWQGYPANLRQEEGYCIRFVVQGQMPQRELIRTVTSLLDTNDIDWLRHHGRTWLFDVPAYRRWIKSKPDTFDEEDVRQIEWLEGAVIVEPERVAGNELNLDPTTVLGFTIYKEDYLMDSKTKIFLSHKGPDKPMVERFHKTLELLGFSPWLDTEAMAGGTELHRGIRQGFKDSCAVVFFVTPNFKDDRYLRTEVNYAADEKIEKGDRFAILVLRMADADGKKGDVPDVFSPYVWKEPKDELEALREIIRAIPFELGPPNWKPGK